MTSWVARNFVFTGQNPAKKYELTDAMRYIVWQVEECPTTKKMHIQGYVEFKKSMRITGVKKELDDPTVHLERRMGSREQARDYCMKEKTRVQGPWELGLFKAGGQGRRNDLARVVDLIKEEATLDEIMNVTPVEVCFFINVFNKIINYI